MGARKQAIAKPTVSTGDKAKKFRWEEVHKHNSEEGNLTTLFRF
jgi:hypothetical protein